MERDAIITELREVERDLAAFSESRSVLHRRIQEMDGTPRQEMFTSWAMMQILLNAYVLAIVRCEGLIQDYRKALEQLEVPNNVVALTSVKGDQDASSGV